MGGVEGGMVVRRALVLGIAFAVVVAIGGCSGTGSNGTPEVGSAFAAKAVAACEKAIESKQQWSAFPAPDFDPANPDPAAFPAVADWLEGQVSPTLETWLDDLQALGEPPSGASDWDDVLAGVADIVQFNADQIEAAHGSDVAAFAEATDGGRATNVKVTRAADAAGVPKCADVHR